MRTIILSLTLILTISFAYAGNDPLKRPTETKYSNVSLAPQGSDKDIDDGGFFLNIGLRVPTKNCYISLGFTNHSSGKFSPGPNLELGNMFKIAPIGKLSIGVRATWLSACYNSWSNSDADMSYIQGSVIRIGPYFTVAMSEKMAMDIFYQIGATYAIDLQTDTAASGRTNAGFIGATSNFGLCFRYKIFSLGVDMNLGNIKYADKEEYKGLDDGLVDDFYKIRTSAFRIFVGFKF
jgi:hypothetical protein